MASVKFLPFITEGSDPLHIFSTLITRSKGLPVSVIASVFYAILKEGINTVRDQAQEYANLTSSQVYEELARHFVPDGINEKMYRAYRLMSPYVLVDDNDWFSEDLLEHDTPTRFIFIATMQWYGDTTGYTTLPIDCLEDPEYILNHLQDFISLGADGNSVTATTIDDVEGFIYYQAVFHPSKDNMWHISLNENQGGIPDDAPPF